MSRHDEDPDAFPLARGRSLKVDIPLGYEVGTGAPVAIPLGHMAVTGQTQAAGKTTTLEALASRLHQDYSLLAFITKRGEGAFVAGAGGYPAEMLQPYFRERADWQFVEAILEATLRERMKYERSWIMKITRGAQTLAEVRENCRIELTKAKAQFTRDMYEKLAAYLDIVVPQLGKVHWSRGLSFHAGLNVMDLTQFTSEVQGLVIGSCLDYVLEKLTNVVVVVPEAWEFVPRGRKSPVTLSAEAFVRKGATLKNYLWIDSQDLAGVHTPILKQMHVFLLGVQREINEITRTIAHLHGPAKPKPQTIAQLGLGQFVACWGANAITTYVQPAWAWPSAAQEAAKVGGRAGAHDSVLVTAGNGMTFGRRVEQEQEEDPMDAQLKADNEKLQRENVELRRQVSDLVARLDSRVHAETRRDYDDPTGPVPSRVRQELRDHADTLPLGTWPAIRAQILNDEQVLTKIATIRPEIVVETAPRVQTLDGSSLKGRLAKLIAAGFFDEPIKAGVANKELNRTGGSVHPANLGRALNDFVLDGYVTRENGDQYQKARALKITARELTAVS